MFVLTIEEEFSSAHQLRGYKGKCENLHGHNWKVVLSVKGEHLNDIGLLIDFGELKAILKSILSTLDHANLNQIPYFSTHNPSSEHIAKYIATQFTDALCTHNISHISLESVTVWESTTSRCTYYP
ncbi:MAG: 6-carboxytetrahydropterin synthase QueD [Spirochaetes bacterium]|nr:6-carboxytetrahydropterin synthase QueD [Spirochaetota bacterium]